MGISVPSLVIGNNLVDLTAGACPVSLENGGRGTSVFSLQQHLQGVVSDVTCELEASFLSILSKE